MIVGEMGIFLTENLMQNEGLEVIAEGLGTLKNMQIVQALAAEVWFQARVHQFTKCEFLLAYVTGQPDVQHSHAVLSKWPIKRSKVQKLRYCTDDSTVFWAVGDESSMIAKHVAFCGQEIEMVVPFEGTSSAKFCDLDLEVALRKNTYFVRNLDGVDLLKRNRSTNLYTINLREMTFASPICLMARATSTKSWLWHQRLSHLNFDTINELVKDNLVTCLPKFKYLKDHLCPSCAQGKGKTSPHKLKHVPNSKKRLHLIHMDLCGPIRVESINGKRYVRYTWVHFLRSKDEATEVIKTFLKKIQVTWKGDWRRQTDATIPVGGVKSEKQAQAPLYWHETSGQKVRKKTYPLLND
ncbi:retrovirus-related pol polyprotein from transposon TNT 1-94 [Tanacetum coccineum]